MSLALGYVQLELISKRARATQELGFSNSSWQGGELLNSIATSFSTFFIKNKTQMQVIALRIYTRTYSIKPLRRDLQRDISPTFYIYTKDQCFENRSSHQWGKVEGLRVKRSNLDQIRIKILNKKLIYYMKNFIN